MIILTVIYKVNFPKFSAVFGGFIRLLTLPLYKIGGGGHKHCSRWISSLSRGGFFVSQYFFHASGMVSPVYCPCCPLHSAGYQQHDKFHLLLMAECLYVCMIITLGDWNTLFAVPAPLIIMITNPIAMIMNELGLDLRQCRGIAVH